MKTAIEVKNVCKKFGNKVIYEDLNIKIEEGDYFASREPGLNYVQPH